MVGHLADIITCAKFKDDIFMGYDFTGGRISHFPIDFCMGLTTVQRDCAACDTVFHSTTTTIQPNYLIPSLNFIVLFVFADVRITT